MEVSDFRVSVCRDDAKGKCSRRMCKYYHLPAVALSAPAASSALATAHSSTLSTHATTSTTSRPLDPPLQQFPPPEWPQLASLSDPHTSFFEYAKSNLSDHVGSSGSSFPRSKPSSTAFTDFYGSSGLLCDGGFSSDSGFSSETRSKRTAIASTDSEGSDERFCNSRRFNRVVNHSGSDQF